MRVTDADLKIVQHISAKAEAEYQRSYEKTLDAMMGWVYCRALLRIIDKLSWDLYEQSTGRSAPRFDSTSGLGALETIPSNLPLGD